MIASSVIACWKDPRRAVWAWSILLGVLAAAVKRQWLIGIDRQAAQWIGGLRTPSLDAAAQAVTFFGSSPWTIAAIAVMGLWWVSTGRRTTLWICLGTALLGVTLQMALRFWVGQWRPDGGVIPLSMDLVTRHDLAGFPSGHAFRSAFLFGWWGRALCHRRTGWATAAAIGCGLLIVVVGLTRIYLRRHWLTDVLGAWLVAAIALSAAERRRPLLKNGAVSCMH